jgi:hypothetical protein
MSQQTSLTWPVMLQLMSTTQQQLNPLQQAPCPVHHHSSSSK